jgi:hypothetical protein
VQHNGRQPYGRIDFLPDLPNNLAAVAEAGDSYAMTGGPFAENDR